MVKPQLISKALPALFEAKQEPVRDGVKKLAVRVFKAFVCWICLPNIINVSERSVILSMKRAFVPLACPNMM